MCVVTVVLLVSYVTPTNVLNCIQVLVNACEGTKLLQTISVQMDIRTRWLSFRKKLTWSVIYILLSLLLIT